MNVYCAYCILMKCATKNARFKFMNICTDPYVSVG